MTHPRHIALITDTHAGVRGDSLVFQESAEQFFDKVFFPELKRRGIKQVVHLGDLMDRRKYANINIVSRMRKSFLDRLEDEKLDTIILAGNHDMPFRASSEVNALHELIGDTRYKHIRCVISPETVVLGDGLKVLLLPWINEGNHDESMKAIQKTKAQVVMGHLELQGFQMSSYETSTTGMDRSIFDKFSLVMSGHFHHKSVTNHIHYLGAPYEMTFADMEDPRGFHVFDTKTLELEHVRNPDKMFHRLYYNDEGKTFNDVVKRDFTKLRGKYVKIIVEQRKEQYWYEKFMEAVQQSEPAAVQIVDQAQLGDDMGLLEVDESKDTRTLIYDFVDQMTEIGNIKDDLKILMSALYAEALTTDATIAS